MLDAKPKVLCSLNRFNVRIVEVGDKYGLDFKLTNKYDQPMVEFYVQSELDEIGHFVSRYLYSTLLERDPTFGLLLDTAEPDQSLSAQEMASIMKIIEDYFDQQTK